MQQEELEVSMQFIEKSGKIETGYFYYGITHFHTHSSTKTIV